MPTPRAKSSSKRPLWIMILISMVCLSLILVHLNPPEYSPCYLLWSKFCNRLDYWPPPVPARVRTDEELSAKVIIDDILSMQISPPKNPKIAFMFLTPGALPFEKLWEKFFLGHEDRFSVYVHASREKKIRVSSFFIGRDVRSKMVYWGQISMIDAEKRLLATALQDAGNQHFVLLSESCVPLHNFDYTYNYLMGSNISYVDCFEDPGPHGMGRYSENMLPEIVSKDWRKGSQWFSIKRKHALILLSDSLYYNKFKFFCRPHMDGNKNCYSDEHYLPTLLSMFDPTGIANWSITHVDWSEGKWHPKSYRAEDATFELLKYIGSIDGSYHVTSGAKQVVLQKPCMWNGTKRPCYLFARKFRAEALDNLMNIFSNFTIF
ncbi:hypothetical protein HPP92_017772 [Vanilla planifolia]|uniref:Core-2/I-branching beta-1,6-N-acetylglucosaminyltransferase family protein n=1 Tax=Vanilla planifolia TaxID=51239 RepID=A0A835UM90_VANPL|nr:hypothetical protein HPP92_017772 [Vanilla planifolia]